MRNGSHVTASIGGQPVTVEAMLKSEELPGLDEIHVLLPSGLRGGGTLDVEVKSDNQASNAVSVTLTGSSLRDIMINEVLADPPGAAAIDLQGDANHALTRIRKVEDQTARLVLYLEALKACQKKKDATLSGTVIGEARSLIPQVERNGLHLRALLAFASQLPALASKDEALDFLDAAVVAINSLPKPSGEATEKKSSMELAWAEINDPHSLLELPEFSKAFSSIGVVDLERALIVARKIEVRSVQLVARLEAVGEVMRIDARRLKSKPAGKTVTRSGR